MGPGPRSAERRLFDKRQPDYEHRSRTYQQIVHAVLDAQRDELVRLRDRGTISNEVMHRLERELDLEDERLEI